jgi:hypothetical protein
LKNRVPESPGANSIFRLATVALLPDSTYGNFPRAVRTGFGKKNKETSTFGLLQYKINDRIFSHMDRLVRAHKDI